MVSPYTPQNPSLNPYLHKRTGDGVFVEIRWTGPAFRAPDGTAIPLNSWYEYDGSRYTAITDAARQANYTPPSRDHKLQYR